MRITIKLGGPLRDKVPCDPAGEIRLDLPEGTWLSQALRPLGLNAREVSILLLNGRPLSEDKVLTSGDRLALFHPCQAFTTISCLTYCGPAAEKILGYDFKEDA